MLDLEALRQRCSDGERFEYIYFWGHQPSKSGRVSQSCLSQWYASPFTIDGVSYPTAEHWMMAAKARLFEDDATLAKILASQDPKTAKALGRTVKHFDDAVWTQHAPRLVVEGNVAKFGQNDELRSFLMATNESVLVEASPYDRIWGIGLKADDDRAKNPATWQGQNLLGFALMEVRNRLR